MPLSDVELNRYERSVAELQESLAILTQEKRRGDIAHTELAQVKHLGFRDLFLLQYEKGTPITYDFEPATQPL